MFAWFKGIMYNAKCLIVIKILNRVYPMQSFIFTIKAQPVLLLSNNVINNLNCSLRRH